MRTIREFLRATAEIQARNGRAFCGYLSTDDFLLRNGREFPRAAELPRGLRMMTPKECFRNAAMVALRRRGLVYCEGYAMTELIPLPLPHAWLLDAHGCVADPTWEDGYEYFGVAIARDFLKRVLSESRANYGRWGVIDRAEDDWPILSATVSEWRHKLNDEP